jgi:hypothetical protein
MSTRKSVRKPRTASKPAAETIPLAGVSIKIARPKIFSSDEETVTFDGERLAGALRWVALACPNLDMFTSAEGVAIELAGVAQICKGLSEADPDFNADQVLHALYCRLDDLASRINAGEHYSKLAALTITRKPAAEVAS